MANKWKGTNDWMPNGCQCMAAVALIADNDKTSLIFLMPAFLHAVRMPIMTLRSEAYMA